MFLQVWQIRVACREQTWQALQRRKKQMSKLDEQGVTTHLQAALRERLKALHIQQQHLHQTTQALCSQGTAVGRSQALWQLVQQQGDLGHTARLLQQDACTVQRVKHANTIRLQYDQLAVSKVERCMRLEQDARLLDGVVGSRQYNRLHPRYSLD